MRGVGAGGQHWRVLGGLDGGGLRSAATRARDLPRAEEVGELLRVARAAQLAAELGLRGEVLARVAVLAPDSADLLVEQAMDAAQQGEPDTADALAARVLADPHVPRWLRGRALLAQGTAAAFRGGSAGKLRAEGLLGEAAELLLAAGEREWAAAALVALGSKVCYLNGDLDRAVDCLERAVAAQPDPDRGRGVSLDFLADALVMVGRVEEAEAASREVAQIGRAFGDRRLLAYAAWSAAMAAAVRGDRVGVHELLHEVERHPGDWYAGPTGAEFLAAAADLLGRLGDPAALSWLERAEDAAARTGYPEIAWLARAAHESRAGDPAHAAELLARLPGSEEVPPREHWRVLLLGALAAQRRGDPPSAGELSARARAAAERLGHPELPELHEPVVTAALAGRAGVMSVAVLGGLTITLAGRRVDLEPGQPRGLVAYLALGGGERTVEEVLEALWPAAEPTAAKVRLRQVLWRLRQDTGTPDLVVRRGDVLRLTAEVDVAHFHAAAQRALTADRSERAALAATALAAYAGDVLPADRYTDWTAAPRERAWRLRLALLDLAAQAHAEEGSLHHALALLEQAIDIEPLDESRYRHAAGLARRLGNEATARGYDDRADTARRNLGPESPLSSSKTTRVSRR